MTKFHQSLDLAVNGYCKHFLKYQFNEWYLGEVIAQINNGVEIDNDISFSCCVFTCTGSCTVTAIYTC